MEQPTRNLLLTDRDKGIVSLTKEPPLGLGYQCLGCAALVEITPHTQWEYSRWRWVGNYRNTFGWYITCPACGHLNFLPEWLAQKHVREQPKLLGIRQRIGDLFSRLTGIL